MSKLKLILACGDYDRTRALIDGVIRPDGVDLNYLPLVPAETFYRMLNHAEFDASEMSLSSYTILRSEGDTRFMAIPIFPSRAFRHSSIFVNPESRINEPADLRGKRIGVGDYQMTAAVWVRGLLQHEYGVGPGEMEWVVGPQIRKIQTPEGVAIRSVASRKLLEQLLIDGELEALISVVLPPLFASGHPAIVRLFADFRRAETDYFDKTGIFPIMHTLVVRTELLEKHPWLAASLYKAFCQAKEWSYRWLHRTDTLAVSLPFSLAEIEESRGRFGADIWDYSIEGSRPTLEAMVNYLHEQGMTRRKMAVEELFVSNVGEGLGEYIPLQGGYSSVA